MEVISALVEARKTRGLTQLARIESGKQSPTLDTLIRICRALNCSLAVVMRGYEDEPGT